MISESIFQNTFIKEKRTDEYKYIKKHIPQIIAHCKREYKLIENKNAAAEFFYLSR